MFQIVYNVASTALCYFLPAYHAYKALDSGDRRRERGALKALATVSVFNFLEFTLLDMFVSPMVPFYGLIKLGFIVWLSHGRINDTDPDAAVDTDEAAASAVVQANASGMALSSADAPVTKPGRRFGFGLGAMRGARYLYRHLIEPWFRRNEPSIDGYLDLFSQRTAEISTNLIDQSQKMAAPVIDQALQTAQHAVTGQFAAGPSFAPGSSSGPPPPAYFPPTGAEGQGFPPEPSPSATHILSGLLSLLPGAAFLVNGLLAANAPAGVFPPPHGGMGMGQVPRRRPGVHPSSQYADISQSRIVVLEDEDDLEPDGFGGGPFDQDTIVIDGPWPPAPDDPDARAFQRRTTF
ncbi:hypothetical protein H696_05229 [Fonticula alba]|uniref:Uncharacterized protein n=1 Tax=Fonticula alba TaxID=691883 RepID=A0A058Z2E6_FONAL|nr:hypothetical protein H696_05229 [Fonticula alba]KCV68311.1 hypothetical protein H696_05229 [Fonticula alba]|eukprot:XP_009497365.1 hypothetical protein H696_05229 [Fonticula alba]